MPYLINFRSRCSLLLGSVDFTRKTQNFVAVFGKNLDFMKIYWKIICFFFKQKGSNKFAMYSLLTICLNSTHSQSKLTTQHG